MAFFLAALMCTCLRSEGTKARAKLTAPRIRTALDLIPMPLKTRIHCRLYFDDSQQPLNQLPGNSLAGTLRSPFRTRLTLPSDIEVCTERDVGRLVYMWGKAIPLIRSMLQCYRGAVGGPDDISDCSVPCRAPGPSAIPYNVTG